MLSRVIAKNVGDVFLRHSVYEKFSLFGLSGPPIHAKGERNREKEQQNKL